MNVPGSDGERSSARSAARLTAVGLGVQVAIAVVALGAAVASRSFVAYGAAAHVGAGALAWAAGAFLASRRTRRADEAAEDDRLAEAAAHEGRKPLFARPGAAGAAASDARLGAAVAVLVALVEAGIAAALVQRGRAPDEPVRLLGAAAAFGAGAFGLLLVAKFALALARGPADSPLVLVAPGARRAASGALAALAAGALLALQHLGPTLRLDGAGWVFVGLEAVLALELLLSLLLELYRPRRKGDVPRPAFESRLLGLLAEPSGVARSFARAVDYQFGFQLSETWVYGLVERGVAPLVVFAGTSFWLLSSFVVVPQGQRAILERLGRPVLPELEPGLHLKLPWPLETVETVQVERIRTVVLGGEDEDEDPAPRRRHRAVLWTKAHAGPKGEAFVLVARRDAGADREAPVDVLEARVELQYVVARPLEHARGAVSPETFLRVLGERELARLGCAHDLFGLLGAERAEAAAELRARVQTSADAHGLGVRIVAASLADVHPPAAVAKDFHAETGALEEGQARRLRGLEDAAGSRPAAEAEARTIRERARTEAAQRVVMARADASRFEAALALDRIAPRVFRRARLLRSIEEALESGGRRIVVPRALSGSAVDLDLGEKLTTDDLGAEPSGPGGGK